MRKTLFILALGVIGASANATTFMFKEMNIDVPEWSYSITTFDVAGLDGPIVDVNLRMRRVQHTFSDDMGALLSNNLGANTLLFNGPGVGFTPGISWDWTFDDSAAAPLPSGNPLDSGVFKPGLYEYEGVEVFTNVPAPYGRTMAGLNGGGNGIWSLQMEDFVELNAGSIKRVDLIITTGVSGRGTNGDGQTTYTAVPEPASMAALALGAVALIRRRRK